MGTCVATTCVLLTSGCTTVVVNKDYYPNVTKKGYALLTGRAPKGTVLKDIAIFQVVDGKMKRFFGDMQVGSVHGDSALGLYLGNSYHYIASSPPGRAMFYYHDVTHPITVDIYECMTTRVTAVYSNPSNSGYNSTSYDISFEIEDPVKGLIKWGQNASIGISGNCKIAGAEFLVKGPDIRDLYTALEIIEEASKGLDLKTSDGLAEFKERFKRLRKSHPELTNVTIVCPSIGSL